jgi:hypothetical protein
MQASYELNVSMWLLGEGGNGLLTTTRGYMGREGRGAAAKGGQGLA